MRILSTVSRNYYGLPGAVEPMYLEFTDPLIDMGHEVETFDHHKARSEIGLTGCGEQFVERVRTGRYDVVFYQTGGGDAMARDAIRDAARYAPVVAWNSDDDWQWESYTRHLAPYFTSMVTTYPHIHRENRDRCPNLILSQWGCYDRFADFDAVKDMDFSFVGLFYGERVQLCRALRRGGGLEAFGPGAGMVNHRFLMRCRRARNVLRRVPALYGRAVSFEAANAIWNRTKISLCPMGGSADPKRLQIKSRAFEMGLSGTLMICQHSPGLEDYYEPGKEFVPFFSVDDCIDKVKHYLRHERDRLAVASAYRDRTRAEHLWQHRFARIFEDIGLGPSAVPRAAGTRQGVRA